ncbi:MAG: AAA domain-containing protein [Desulfobulbaceae bacterium]|nr:AAA domain-containing protein [Desulfobulbaceae bacterium]
MKLDAEHPDLPTVEDLINGMPHGIAILDTKLCLLAMNQRLECMTGFRFDEVRGIYGDFILRTSLGNYDQVNKAVLENGQQVSKDGNIISKGRKKIPIHFSFSRLHNHKNIPIGILIHLEDVSVLQVKNSQFQDQAESLDILGHSRQMEEVFELMSVLARTDASVLITGETGTGKDKIAEQIHKSSQRGRQPFIKINCGALPEALLESELFGHVKGAFTGAVNDNAGMFRLADKGTVFLTEIGDLPLQLQVKLLSVLDDRAFYPVGGSKKVEVDVRVIAATHRSLRLEVESGNFREDLFYRLNVLHLHIPPLRDREGDIRLLLDYFLRQIVVRLPSNITGFTQKAIDILNHYSYPGNVRELRNIVEYAVTVCQGKEVGNEDLPPYLTKPAKPTRLAAKSVSTAPSVAPEPSVDSALGGWAEVEKANILEALKKSQGNRSKAAEILGYGRTTLWRKLKKYKLA